ncbi:hypothetical protein [Aestuariivivens sediminicola]|uniref:hypothetical protein n=1 Tax=Aestuariivivens sediminicola TaxID=2913560 RepID=UPI001F55D879|nr:hypothetical protein [Aestuariivivens sediminicola]
MKTKLLSTALIGLLLSITVNCSHDYTMKSDVQQDVMESPLANYEFIGNPLGKTLMKSDNGVTKTIKFYDGTGPFGFDFNVGGCTPDPYLTITGNGNASHIGYYTVENYGCYDGVSPILGIITAANGDKIYTYVVSAVQNQDTGIWTYHYVVYDGTGRFTDVYGDIYMHGNIDFDNWTWIMSGEGEITY